MSDDVMEPSPEAIAPQLPGALLRQTREAKGLSVAEVASAIKFHPRQIEAIESDDYDSLQGRTFLRGFVRAYARALQLDAEPLLEMLDHAMVFREEVVVPPDNMGETNPRPFYVRHARKLLIATLAAAAIGGVGLAYLNADLQSVLRKTSTTTTTQAAPANETNMVAMNPVTIADSSNAETGGATASPASVGVSATATATQGASTATGANGSQTVPALEFEFSGLSWLEVKDGSGRVLVTGEIPAGQKRSVDGKPPYDLWIGKASAVKVTYKGQTVDVTPYTHDEVARLTLN